ncbi:MAG: hypothetical protein ACKO3K_00280 [Cuspidothrix sp.]
MDYSRIEYIKNVNDLSENWAYPTYPMGSYFQLNFRSTNDNEDNIKSHALDLLQGSLIILSQRPTSQDRYLTHIVELVNEGSEDRPQWQRDEWGIFRWVKVHWVANFNDPNSIPLDKDVMKANWGWYDTKAKRLESDNLMSVWKNINDLRTHLQTVFN